MHVFLLIRACRANIGLRVVASIVLIAIIDLVALVTGLPVVTCLTAVYRDGATPWLLLVAQAALLFSIGVILPMAKSLHYLWSRDDTLMEFDDHA